MSVLKVIKIYFKQHKIKLFFILLLIIITTILSLLPSQILRIIIDDTITENKLNMLIKYSIIYGVCFLVIGIISFIKDIIMLSTSQYITKSLKENMMNHIHNMTYNELINNDSGTLESYFNNDVNSINELFTSGVISIITDLFKMVGIIITIFIYSYLFGIIMLVILPILVLFTSFIRKKMLNAQLKTKSLEGNVNKSLLESIENIEQIKVNKANNYAIDKYDIILNNHFKASQASNFYDAVFSPIMQIVRNVVVVAILLLSGYNNSIFGMTVGMIISGISLITDLFTPIENLGMEIQTIQKSMASIKRINQFFKTKEDPPKNEYSINNTSIVYNNVSFSYDEKEVISNFNLVINNSDKIALQGPSGAGKSTLMKLALGQIKPSSGTVTIDGINIFDMSDNMKKELFSVVYQDSFFSGGTIYEEISLLDKRISKEKVKKALNDVGLYYINDLDCPLNPNNYSSGELALFNIARVVVRDTKIIFLDEMNAKIDPITAKQIIEVFNKLTKDKVVISINHYGKILDNAKIVNVEPVK